MVMHIENANGCTDKLLLLINLLRSLGTQSIKKDIFFLLHTATKKQKMKCKKNIIYNYSASEATTYMKISLKERTPEYIFNKNL